MPISHHHFTIHSSTEVDQLISQLLEKVEDKLWVHISSYMHNTVMVHNLITQLKKHYPEIRIVQLPYPKDKGTLVTLFTYGSETARMMEDKEINPVDMVLDQISQERHNLDDQLSSSKQELIKHFFTDSLTKLPNLYQLREDIEDNSNHTLITFSIDNFKMVNDFYGHVAGDFLLEQVAQKFQNEIPGVTIYRLSGSEFALTIEQSFTFYELKNYLHELALKFKHLSFNYANTVIYLDITFASIVTADREELFSKVSMALQYAKTMKQAFWIYEDRMHFQHFYENNLKTSLKIRNAIMNSGIVPYFQPILCNKTDKIVQYECLSRLIDENGSVHDPLSFIPIAKTIKVYSEITRTIINKSFEAFKDTDLHFSINISIDDILNEEVYDFILDKLRHSGMGSQVTFEFLESEQIEDYARVTRFITEVKRFGAKVAIDDFGSGYSNFSYLTHVHIDYIKIDGELIKSMEHNKASELVVETIVTFAHKLGIKTVAEYVHSSTLLARVKELEIDYSQGFEIDQPHPIIK